MYVKRINRTQIQSLRRPYLCAGGRIYTNPSPEQLRKAGYKPLVEKAPCPKELEDGHVVYYEEDDCFVYICYCKEGERI